MTFGSLGPSNFLPHGWVFLFLAGCWMRSPCEDIMGTNWLRVAAWMVASASVVGNLAVIIVLSSSRSTMVVSKFLMINLATADLFMGIYLFLIAGMDLHSSGVYFNYANDWQNGKIQNRYHTEDDTKKKKKKLLWIRRSEALDDDGYAVNSERIKTNSRALKTFSVMSKFSSVVLISSKDVHTRSPKDKLSTELTGGSQSGSKWTIDFISCFRLILDYLCSAEFLHAFIYNEIITE